MYPDVVSFLHQHKRKAPLLLGNAHPDLTIHEQAMVKVHHLFLYAPWTTVDRDALLSLFPTQSV